tara:strand:+ start:3658 stop:4620 length:963 start_codon:yes stop_codon:yes gene_type:complete
MTVGNDIGVWDNYWKRGELHSCIPASDKDSQNDINCFWQDFFSSFGDDQVLLDIGTGNGLLPSLAVRYANEQGFGWEVHGIDLADIDPVRDVPALRSILDQVNFQGRINCEDLPFDEEYFDVVTAQYAVEYSEISKSISEIHRVLKKGGTCCLVLHSDHSLVVSQNKLNIAESDYLLGRDIFLRCKEGLSQILASGRSAAQVSEDLMRYRRTVESLSEDVPEKGWMNVIPIMQSSLLEILNLRSLYHPAQVVGMIDHAKRRLKEQRDVLCTLVKAALDSEDRKAFIQDLSRTRFDVTMAQDFCVGEKQLVLGCCYQLKKQ